MLSNISVQQHALPEAEERLEQILDEYPDDISALTDLGYLWVDQGKYLQRSLHMIERAVAAEPDNAAYRDSLGWAYFRLGRHEEARAELERAIDEEDPDPTILDHLGDVYAQLDKPAEAREAWQQALEKFDPTTHAKLIETTRKKLAQTESPDPTP